MIEAHKAGAVAAILYMDPENYAKEGVDKVFPHYNWMPNTGVQRGTIKYTPARGDVLTPGYPSTGRFPYTVIEGIIKLPTLEETGKKRSQPETLQPPEGFKSG